MRSGQGSGTRRGSTSAAWVSFGAVPLKEHRGVKVGPRRFRQRVASVLVKADRGRLSEMFLRRGIVAYAEIDSGGGC